MLLYPGNKILESVGIGIDKWDSWSGIDLTAIMNYLEIRV